MTKLSNNNTEYTLTQLNLCHNRAQQEMQIAAQLDFAKIHGNKKIDGKINDK